MARRRKSNRRGRGSGFRFLYRLLSMAIICACLIAAVTLFFKVDTVIVSGQERYTGEEILAASGVETGDNLFLLNKFDIVKQISEKLPYIEIENIWIRRKLPDTLLIDVKECGEPLAIRQEGVVWLVSYTGKIVEQTDSTGDCVVIDGPELLAPSVGTKMTFGTDYETRLKSLLSLLQAVEESGKRQDIQAIHLDRSGYLTIDYLHRFSVRMDYDDDYAYKLVKLQAIMDKGVIQPNVTGILDMRGENGETRLIQTEAP